jgi:hypothetical protein
LCPYQLEKKVGPTLGGVPFVLLSPYRNHAYPHKFFLKTELPTKMLIIHLGLKQVASNAIFAFNPSKERVLRYALKVKEESSGWKGRNIKRYKNLLKFLDFGL